MQASIINVSKKKKKWSVMEWIQTWKKKNQIICIVITIFLEVITIVISCFSVWLIAIPNLWLNRWDNSAHGRSKRLPHSLELRGRNALLGRLWKSIQWKRSVWLVHRTRCSQAMLLCIQVLMSNTQQKRKIKSVDVTFPF